MCTFSAKNHENDDASIDSTNSVFTEKVSHRLVHKAGYMRWRIELSPEMKTVWNNRATKLNRRKLPGKFLVVPWKNGLKQQVLNSLSFEWNELVGVFKRCLTRESKKIISTLRYRFSDELVTIGSLSYQDFRVSFLVEISLFGSCYELLYKNEIIKRTKKQIIVHIASKKRMD